MIDKNLFKYELAIVAILKNEAPYIKEWIDYHLLAGVDHFYLYDNDSEDNLKEVLQPYIDNEIVTYKFYPGRCLQNVSYLEAIRDYKFDCKYMLILDADEFVFPKDGRSIKDFANEFFSKSENISGFAINWNVFGSANQDKADLSRMVIDRFRYHAKEDFGPNKFVNTISNPRHIKLPDPHCPKYFINRLAVNENLEPVLSMLSESHTSKTIVVNHYFTKSKEEFIKKRLRGTADQLELRKESEFNSHDKNDIYDEGILKYFESRKMGGVIDIEPLSQINNRRLNALLKILTPMNLAINLDSIELGNLNFDIETILTCRAIIKDLNLSENDKKFLEEISLKYLSKILNSGTISIYEIQILIREIPKILKCNYPVVDDIKRQFKIYLQKFIDIMPQLYQWRDVDNLIYFQQLIY